jgi:TetR/AcrR family transcriptional regulator, regulator of mycofactocin system
MSEAVRHSLAGRPEAVATRVGLDPGDLLPRTVGHVSLALALSANEVWLDSPETDLLELLDGALAGVRQHLAV